VYVEGSILPNHRSQEQLDQDVRDFYDYWKATYVMDAGEDGAGNPLYRIAFAKDGQNFNQTVSEGQGYGMVIVAVMAGHDPEAQAIFDGLWRFVRAHPSEVDPRLMDWKVPESEYGDDSAFDGDADIAFGLLLADAQWGSAGVIDYQTEAVKLITAIRESTIGSDSLLPLLGDWVGVGDETYNQYTPRSSDFMLVNFRAFATASGDESWNEVVTNSQQVMNELQINYSLNTGLMPDFIVLAGEGHVPQPAPPDFLEASSDGSYSYNAGRVPWRVGSDALLYDDASSAAIAGRISHWAEDAANGDPFAIKAGYDLDGTPLPDSDYFTTFFAAPLGVATMLDPDQQEWLNSLYDSVYNTHDDYYEDSVTLLCLITMTGNMWVP
jgi:endo-1,4-beta-D-glucanase Y